MEIDGACHCGNLRYRFDWPGNDAEIPVRACSCDFCQKHGAVYTSHPDGALRAEVREVAALSRYRFGHSTADFFVCARCGAIVFATSEIDGVLHAVINVKTFEGIDPAILRSNATDFDGESVDDRLARRHRNWVRDVEIRGLS